MKIFRLTTALAMSLALASPLMANDKPGEGKPAVRVVMPAQIEEHFHHYILLRALQELGYETAEPAEAEYQTMHIAIGGGDADFTANHWHALHAAFCILCKNVGSGRQTKGHDIRAALRYLSLPLGIGHHFHMCRMVHLGVVHHHGGHGLGLGHSRKNDDGNR